MKNVLTLNELSDEKLNIILTLSEEEKTVYFDNLIKRFYPKIDLDDDDYHKLQKGYRSSFYMEKIYRSNMWLYDNFSLIYTKTGLIRNCINDIYYTNTDDLVTH